MKRKLILASSSPRRSQLLRECSIPFEVIPSQAEELQPSHLSPREICQINAYRKARWVAKNHPDALVLGADTLVFLGQEIFGKPRDMEHARQMLGRLQGQAHQVITGVCLLCLRDHHQHVFAETTHVRFQPLNEDQIVDYLKIVHPLDKAGGYAIQEHGERLVASIEGSFTNVVGLPVERIRPLLQLF